MVQHDFHCVFAHHGRQGQHVSQRFELGIQIALLAATTCLGTTTSTTISLQNRGHLLRSVGLWLQHRIINQKKLPVPKTWNDLLNPAFKGEIQVANPASSVTPYTMVATLVQLMGEDKAFDYMRALHKNISQYSRSGTGPIKAAARGETTVSISFVHDGPGEKMQGFPIETITPSDGTGSEIGSMSIIKGARNLEVAKQFY